MDLKNRRLLKAKTEAEGGKSVPIAKVTVKDRERPFQAVVPEDKRNLVLEGADDAACLGNFKGRPENRSDACMTDAIAAPDRFNIR